MSNTLSKEEILNKYDTSRKYIEQTCRPELFAGMDEYAKLVGIDFLAWVMKQDFQWRPLKSDGDEWMIFDRVERTKKYTTKELYDLYLLHKQNKEK